MKNLKKMVIAIIMVFAMTAPVALPWTPNAAVAEAATVRISQKSLTLVIGKTKMLSIKGTEKKVTWKTSDKEVATVTAAGKVKAVAAGTAKITATVSGKKYTCSLTVKHKENPYIAKADYDAVEVAIGDVNIVIPKEYSFVTEQLGDDNYSGTITPKETLSSILISVEKTNEAAVDYEVLKAGLDAMITQDYLQNTFAATETTKDAVISDFNKYDLTTTKGTAYVITYNIAILDQTMNQTIYELFIDNYDITVTVTDVEALGLNKVVEYALDSMRIFAE